MLGVAVIFCQGFDIESNVYPWVVKMAILYSTNNPFLQTKAFNKSFNNYDDGGWVGGSCKSSMSSNHR